MKNFFLIIALFIGGSGFAQQLPNFVFYQDGGALTNPAMLSSNYFKYDMALTANLAYRYQWVGLEDAPQTALGNFQYYNYSNQFLMGATILNDQTGSIGFSGVYGRGAYSLFINRDIQLSMGLAGGLVQYRVKGSELNFYEPGDKASQNVTKFYPDFGLGAVLYYKKKYFAGVSVPQSFGLNLNFRDNANDFQIKRVQHYYGTLGAYFETFNDSWLLPTIWVKYVPNTPLHLDANLKYEYNETFWVGAGGSTAGAMHLETGVVFSQGGYNSFWQMRIGYAFNYFFNTYGPEFGTAHELKVSFSVDP